MLRFICETVSRLKYGQVIIYVQDGEIIQIDTTEKVRFRQCSKRVEGEAATGVR